MSRRHQSCARLHAIGVGDPVQPRELRHVEAAALRDLADTFARADLVEVRRRERRRRRGSRAVPQARAPATTTTEVRRCTSCIHLRTIISRLSLLRATQEECRGSYKSPGSESHFATERTGIEQYRGVRFRFRVLASGERASLELILGCERHQDPRGMRRGCRDSGVSGPRYHRQHLPRASALISPSHAPCVSTRGGEILRAARDRRSTENGGAVARNVARTPRHRAIQDATARHEPANCCVACRAVLHRRRSEAAGRSRVPIASGTPASARGSDPICVHSAELWIASGPSGSPRAPEAAIWPSSGH